MYDIQATCTLVHLLTCGFTRVCVLEIVGLLNSAINSLFPSPIVREVDAGDELALHVTFYTILPFYKIL